MFRKCDFFQFSLNQIVLLVLCTVSYHKAQQSCTTPNDEQAFCTPIQSCLILLEAVKSPTKSIVDFVKRSICDVDTRSVCCGGHADFVGPTCTTPNREIGRCVPLETCEVIYEGIKIFNETVVEFAKASTCKTENHQDGYYCCGSVNHFTNGEGDDSRMRHKQHHHPHKNHKIIVDSKKLVSDRRYCGQQHTDDYHYISEQTAIDEFPWTALLVNKSEKLGDPICLAALISKKYLLTTSPCLGIAGLKPDEVATVTTVVLGEYNTTSKLDCVTSEECSEQQEIDIEEILLHPKYKYSIHHGLQYAVALIRLERSVEFNDYVRPICLPDTPVRAQIGDNATTTGWGTIDWFWDFQKGQLVPNKGVPIKKRGQAILEALSVCTLSTKSDLGPYSEEKELCAREITDKGVCGNDIGAPLMWKSSKFQWQLEGILLAPMGGHDCKAGALYLYLNVGSVLEWIYKNIRP